NPTPTGTFVADITRSCAPATITFSATSSNGATDQYTWVMDKTVAGTTNPLSYSFPVADSITVSLQIVSAQGCTATVTAPDYIVTYPKPDAAFVADPTTKSILDPNFNFINMSTGATTYLWDFGDPVATGGSNSSTLLSPSHSYSFTGQYNVSLMAT